MKFKVTIRMDNAAFEGDLWQDEVDRILTNIKLKFGTGVFDVGCKVPLHDSNGNPCGTVRITEE